MDKKKKIQVNKLCPQCKEIKTIYMTEEEQKNYSLYLSGEGLIQNMLPNISPPDRELLRGGMCGDCWKKIFVLPCSE